uniref:Formyl_trans_C domain-containing protein n=1 Tax=Steinernema glaseri TaxID=37863 RepID=A0A1I8ATB2_9BILA
MFIPHPDPSIRFAGKRSLEGKCVLRGQTQVGAVCRSFYDCVDSRFPVWRLRFPVADPLLAQVLLRGEGPLLAQMAEDDKVAWIRVDSGRVDGHFVDPSCVKVPLFLAGSRAKP